MAEPHKYTCNVKVEAERFVKYRTSDLIQFAHFLDTKYPDWRWFNVFNKTTKQQIANFTRSNRPTTKHV